MRRIALAALVASAAACSKNPPPIQRVVGQTSFASAPPAGGSSGGRSEAADGSAAGAPSAAGSFSTPATRTVEETDLYRLEGDRLYYLNGYRGLMVFDVSQVDQPKLIGRSPIYGWPVDMIVRNGVATVVVADWYGQLDDGTPFHGSIVRGLDASDPSNIKVLGEAKLGGWVRDDRVVGDVLYAVSEDYGWTYGWEGSGGGVSAISRSSVIVSSVSFKDKVIQSVGFRRFDGYGGVFNVTPSSILLAHDAATAKAETELLYLDISDPGGAIVERGRITVPGRVQGWGADNGRWNLDFADGKTAHVIGSSDYWGSYGGSYILDTVDFSNPDAPVLKSQLSIPSDGWTVSARFDANRLYLSPYSWSGSTTPFAVYDLSDPSHPTLAGSATIPGSVWNMIPAPEKRLFALGSDSTQSAYGGAVSLKYLDVSNASAPSILGTSTFGEGWAWTPAAGTFKAFTMDAAQGLVVLPFSGWSSQSQAYVNGLQLIEFTPTSQTTAGAARTRGWVERGIFVKGRLVALSDTALSVIDYADHKAPKVIRELTLARNVIAAQPGASTIAEISTDWWGNDLSTSEIRVLPLANAQESTDGGDIPSALVEGVNAQVFRNGDFAYLVTDVRVPVDCPATADGTSKRPATADGTPTEKSCSARAQQIQVVDLSNGGARLRGKVRLPVDPWGYYGWGWRGCYWYDWYGGADVVQVGNDALALRRWQPFYGPTGDRVGAESTLYVVDLANPDAPALASTTITEDPQGWWGNMRVVGSTLYTTHYEWEERTGSQNEWTVRYFADRIDLSDRSHPRVEAKINVPGLIVGGSKADPSLLYTIDYRWADGEAHDDFDVVRVSGDVAELLSTTPIDGWVGQVFVRGAKAYFSAQQYTSTAGRYSSKVSLHALDLSDPSAPVDRVSSSQEGWGWLLAVEGDRAVVSSGWGPSGVDVYTLADGQAPKFSQFARTQGWWTNAVQRQNDALFLSSGYWGVQRIDLK